MNNSKCTQACQGGHAPKAIKSSPTRRTCLRPVYLPFPKSVKNYVGEHARLNNNNWTYGHEHLQKLMGIWSVPLPYMSLLIYIKTERTLTSGDINTLLKRDHMCLKHSEGKDITVLHFA
jgi:hypothetical protein